MATDWKALHGDYFRNTRILITGGAGFIGSHLTEVLLDLGAHVVVLDDLSGGSRDNFATFADRAGQRLEFLEGSILDESLVGRATAGCRFVYHQAALGSVPRSVEQPVRYHEVNSTGTLRVLEAARAAKVQRVMFAGSSSAYGNTPRLPKVETMPPLPRSPYASTKLAGEHLMAAYAHCYGLDTAVLRYFNIFGPRQNANSAYAAVIAAFAKALLAGQQPLIYGDGEQSRDFTFVHNAVHANLLAARVEKPIEGKVFNVACARRVTVNELAESMAQLLAPQAGLRPKYVPERAGDVKHSLADLSRTETELGYKPIVDFGAGLGITCAWYKSVMK